MAHLYRVIVPVSDIDGAATFYTTVLQQTGRRVSPGRHYFDCEGTLLACFDPQADGDRHEAQVNPEHIYIAVDDLDACFARCKSAGAELDPGKLGGGSPLGAIATRPWGERSFYVFDPFGNPLCFVDRATVFTG
ncbi:MAG: VOC family protein [Gammaproteobacteria bacterium]|nr:VOC family protein [Gammaproteobacteria bacterium]